VLDSVHFTLCTGSAWEKHNFEQLKYLGANIVQRVNVLNAPVV